MSLLDACELEGASRLEMQVDVEGSAVGPDPRELDPFDVRVADPGCRLQKWHSFVCQSQQDAFNLNMRIMWPSSPSQGSRTPARAGKASPGPPANIHAILTTRSGETWQRSASVYTCCIGFMCSDPELSSRAPLVLRDPVSNRMPDGRESPEFGTFMTASTAEEPSEL